MSSTLRPSMVHGSIKWSCGLASSLVGSSNAAISIPPTILQPVCVTIWKSIIPTTPIRIGGPIRASPWSGLHLLVKPAASDIRGEHGLVLGQNDLNGLFIHLGLISAPLHYW